jgi:hypothetical protein
MYEDLFALGNSMMRERGSRIERFLSLYKYEAYSKTYFTSWIIFIITLLFFLSISTLYSASSDMSMSQLKDYAALEDETRRSLSLALSGRGKRVFLERTWWWETSSHMAAVVLGFRFWHTRWIYDEYNQKVSDPASCLSARFSRTVSRLNISPPRTVSQYLTWFPLLISQFYFHYSLAIVVKWLDMGLRWWKSPSAWSRKNPWVPLWFQYKKWNRHLDKQPLDWHHADPSHWCNHPDLAIEQQNKKPKTYNSRYSLVVTHPTTNLPIWSFHLANTQNGAIQLAGEPRRPYPYFEMTTTSTTSTTRKWVNFWRRVAPRHWMHAGEHGEQSEQVELDGWGRWVWLSQEKWYKGPVSRFHISQSSVCNFVYFLNICYNGTENPYSWGSACSGTESRLFCAEYTWSTKPIEPRLWESYHSVIHDR